MGQPPLCVAMPCFIKECIKKAIILNLNIHHALKENNTHNMLNIISQYKRKQIKHNKAYYIKKGKKATIK